MAKVIYHGQDARDRILKGAEELYDAVRTTMGPKGRNVVIGRSQYGPVSVTHDGVTVAKAVDVNEDPNNPETFGLADGADLIRQAASKTGDNVGDGTTTSTVLAYHILNGGNKLIAAEHNPMDLKRGIDKAAAFALVVVDEQTQQIKGDREKIAQVATVSAGDAEIGEMIAEIVEAIGEDGVVTVEKTQGLGIEKDITSGFKFDRGYASTYLVTNTKRMEAEYKDVPVLVCDQKLTSSQELLPLMESMAQSGKKELVIIAESIDGEALSMVVLNRLKGIFNALVINAPSFGERRREILQDIATTVGADLIGELSGIDIRQATFENLGKARKVISSKDSTTIVEGGGDITDRMSQLTAQIDSMEAGYPREELEKRRAALAGKVAVIKVGGATDTEIGEKKDRVDDAVAATKAAVAGGIVAGGGVTLLYVARALVAAEDKQDLSEDELPGWQLVAKALRKPFAQLMQNAGKETAVLSTKLEGLSAVYGIDVKSNTDKPIDLIEAGIVDPALVTRQALQNAVSVSGTALTMGALIVSIPERQGGE